MHNTIFIVGHQNPDTDSICSAIAYAELKRKLGINAKPMRLGDISRETAFVLKYFNVKEPEFLPTVRTRVSDLDIDVTSVISPEISVKNAWMIMKKSNLGFLPVVDENEKLVGSLTISDISNKYMDPLENSIIRASQTSMDNIVETIKGRILAGKPEEFVARGKVVVAAMSPEKLTSTIEDGDIVITGDLVETQKEAIKLGASCLILTNGIEATKDIIEYANEKNCIIVSTPYETFTVGRMINQSVPVKYIMTAGNLVTFSQNDFLEDVKEIMLQKRHKLYPVVDSGNRVVGLLSRFHLISAKKKQIVLVDHNSKAQSVDGIEDAEITEIIDHHRVADVHTGNPIYFRNEPVGSTCTIIANMYFENGVVPSRSIAGILCAAILSDTVKFRSPTCTYTDRSVVEKLAKIAGINIDDFTLEMFKAGSFFEGKTPKEIFYQDFKDFVFGKKRVGIGQVNTITTEGLKIERDKILEYMGQIAKEKNYYFVMLIITDVVKEGSECLFAGEGKEIAYKLFKKEPVNNIVLVDGIISRKKQIIPALSAIME